ncbi:unnamed protein product [Orchesella dallaii]|uniref:Uncharacterized protein n=1 Tax=Orchesella dallaii TaxID=48710 RepID=A0ABP1S130_9HEXA
MYNTSPEDFLEENEGSTISSEKSARDDNRDTHNIDDGLSRENSDVELESSHSPPRPTTSTYVEENYNGVGKYETVKTAKLPHNYELTDENNNAEIAEIAEEISAPKEPPETSYFLYNMLQDSGSKSKVMSGTSCCCWWKCRAMQSGKCRVQPLITKPKSKCEGYGIKTKKKVDENKDNLFKKVNVVKGLCSVCLQSNSTQLQESKTCDECEEEEIADGQKDCNSFIKPKPMLVTESEYRSAYQLPCENGALKSSRTVTLNDQFEQLGKIHMIYNRPPWNYSTLCPPPGSYESLRNTETKLNELDLVLRESKLDNIVQAQG